MCSGRHIEQLQIVNNRRFELDGLPRRLSVTRRNDPNASDRRAQKRETKRESGTALCSSADGCEMPPIRNGRTRGLSRGQLRESAPAAVGDASAASEVSAASSAESIISDASARGIELVSSLEVADLARSTASPPRDPGLRAVTVDVAIEDGLNPDAGWSLAQRA